MKTRLELGKFFQEHYKTGVGAEIGVQRGFFSKHLSKDYKGTIVCVDIWDDEQIFQEAKNNLTGQMFHLKQGLSVDVSKKTTDESLDWVYVDADHSYEGIKSDLKCWYPKVRKGGIISGHDYFDGERQNVNFQVKKAVDEFAKEKRKKVETTTDDIFEGLAYDSWWFIK
jgi:predicted O-methyltransferase YrrM